MDVGIGIPNAVTGTTGPQLLEWARRADRAGFSSLATIGAVSYPSYEELTVLAAAGAVTERIRLMSNVLIAPARTIAELAKQVATVDQLTGGRLSLGVGSGWRSTDFTLTGRDFHRRGRLFDELLPELARALSGEQLQPDTRPVAPPTVQSPVPLLIGGTSDAAIRRVVEYGAGWTAGGFPPEAVAEVAQKVHSAWQQAGRAGRPRIVALAYFGLGDTHDESYRNLIHYYEPMGREAAEYVAAGTLRSEEEIRKAIAGFAAAGVDELCLSPSVSDPTQVDLLAEIAFT